MDVYVRVHETEKQHRSEITHSNTGTRHHTTSHHRVLVSYLTFFSVHKQPRHPCHFSICAFDLGHVWKACNNTGWRARLYCIALPLFAWAARGGLVGRRLPAGQCFSLSYLECAFGCFFLGVIMSYRPKRKGTCTSHQSLLCIYMHFQLLHMTALFE